METRVKRAMAVLAAAPHDNAEDTGSAVTPFARLLCDVQRKIDARKIEDADDFHKAAFANAAALGPALGAQLSSWLFLWSVAFLRHPLAASHRFEEFAAAWLPIAATEGAPPTLLPALGKSVLTDVLSAPVELNYLEIFIDRVRSLAGKQLHYIETHQAPSLSLMNVFGHESMEIKAHFAWSVPNKDALAFVAQHSPLIEVGGGSGYWAAMLRIAPYNADVKCFNRPIVGDGFGPTEAIGAMTNGGVTFGEPSSVQLGGPEVLDRAEADGRTLLLMWPDYNGTGSFGLECLRRYRGGTLVLIGEWQGCTFGLPGRPAHGQSFSLEAQEFVKSRFDLVETIRVPNWPLFLDVIQVFRRRKG